MQIVVIVNFSRSGGTLLTRVLGMLDNAVIASEINPLCGANPDNEYDDPSRAVRRQMKEWHGIELAEGDLVETIDELARYCERHDKVLVVRDWSQLDFVSSPQNGFDPSGRFRLIEILSPIAELRVIGFVRDAIDVFLSSSRDLEVFGREYRRYVERLVELDVPILKYEDLVSRQDETVEALCALSGLNYSNAHRRFADNRKATGDIQAGKASRGIRAQTARPLARKWAPASVRRAMEADENLREANRLLGYPDGYRNDDVESFLGMVKRKSINRMWKLLG